MSKKGQVGSIGGLASVAITLAVVGIVGALAVKVSSDFQGDQVSGSAAFNATGEAITGQNNLLSNLGTIGTVAGAVVLIALVVGAFRAFR